MTYSQDNKNKKEKSLLNKAKNISQEENLKDILIDTKDGILKDNIDVLIKEIQNMNKEFEKRRRKLAKLIGKDGIAVIPTASTRVRSRDTDYPYRPDSDFYYFTGFSEPNAVMILAPGREDGSFILCLREKNQSLNG